MAFDQQIRTENFDGASFDAALNGWWALDGYTLIAGVSLGWERGNSIKELKSVVVEETFATTEDSTATVKREFRNKDVAAFRGEYETFDVIPLAIDLFVSKLSVSTNVGLWAFARATGVEGERSRSSAFGAGLYVFKERNPFAPLGAINFEWLPGEDDFRLNFTAGIEVF